jgi:hypothetical protein
MQRVIRERLNKTILLIKYSPQKSDSEMCYDTPITNLSPKGSHSDCQIFINSMILQVVSMYLDAKKSIITLVILWRWARLGPSSVANAFINNAKIWLILSELVVLLKRRHPRVILRQGKNPMVCSTSMLPSAFYRWRGQRIRGNREQEKTEV